MAVDHLGIAFGRDGILNHLYAWEPRLFRLFVHFRFEEAGLLVGWHGDRKLWSVCFENLE